MDINIHNVGSLTPEQRSALNRRAARNIIGFIMLKFFLAIFLNKTARSLEKRVDAK